MAKRNLYWDLISVTRGLETVVRASVNEVQSNSCKRWKNSSVRLLLQDFNLHQNSIIKQTSPEKLIGNAKESFERVSMIYYGVAEFAKANRDYSAEQGSKKWINHASPTENIAVTITPWSTEQPTVPPIGVTKEDLQIPELTERDKQLITKLEEEHENKLNQDQTKMEIPQPLHEPTFNQTLNPDAKQRTVPASRLGRFLSFGALAAGLGVGTIAEITRRAVSPNVQTDVPLDRVFLSEANAERIVATLCKVRGAALKIGQIFSIQDNTVISPSLQKAFERVRQSADFMPTWQVHKMLVQELGADWRNKLALFEEKPFAAASIGQVHLIKLLDGKYAAMKIQYPGVAAGINSDVDNLFAVMNVWNVFPKGLFIDNLVEVAKRELAWEVDYVREKECTKKFKALLKPYDDYVVPEVIDDLCTKYVFTTELIDGVPVDQCINLDESSRTHVARLVMNLCLLELFEFRYMQTDPNWSNFFYNLSTRKLALLDFGASREYSKPFMDKYIEVIKAAVDGDGDEVLQLSKDLKFLTGYESKNMEIAHVNAVMILGEVFSSEKPFDFGKQDTTKRIQQLVPTIVAERLCPPPEEIYSIHRKLSGVFLLCAKLRVKMSCRDLFFNVYNNYKKSDTP